MRWCFISFGSQPQDRNLPRNRPGVAECCNAQIISQSSAFAQLSVAIARNASFQLLLKQTPRTVPRVYPSSSSRASKIIKSAWQSLRRTSGFNALARLHDKNIRAGTHFNLNKDRRELYCFMRVYSRTLLPCAARTRRIVTFLPSRASRTSKSSSFVFTEPRGWGSSLMRFLEHSSSDKWCFSFSLQYIAFWVRCECHLFNERSTTGETIVIW